MDQNNRLEAKISEEETRTLLTTDLEVLLLRTRTSLQDLTSHVGTIIRTMEDHMITAQINHSKETTETDLELDLSTIRMGTGETMETFLNLHRLEGETSQKMIPTVNQEVINLTNLPSTDLTIDPRLVLRLTNKNSRKTIIRLHLMWFASPKPTKTLTNYQTSHR